MSGAYICINENLSSDTLSGNFDDLEGAVITTEKYYRYVGRGLSSDKFSYFQPILDRLDYKPSIVEPIPSIVITEGKNYWYTFKYFNDIIINKYPEFKFYPGAGVDKLWDIIRLYLSWGKYFLVILDGDDAGKQAQQKYLNEFGDFVKCQIFTLNDIFKRNITTEDLISDSDKKIICDAVYGDGNYDKIKNKRLQLKRQ